MKICEQKPDSYPKIMRTVDSSKPDDSLVFPKLDLVAEVQGLGVEFFCAEPGNSGV